MRLIEHFFSLIAPHECINCGAEGVILCEICTPAQLETVPERCYRCNWLSPNSKTCNVCRHHSVLKHMWVRTSYTPKCREIIHALKFDFARTHAVWIAQEIASVLPPLPNATVITHVPAATSHIRQRGFDQSALIARELGHILGLPHIHLLARTGQQRQVGSSGKTRREQMKNAFRVVSPEVTHDALVLLIDDVLTTGSTIESAARALRDGGAKAVSAAVLAQAK